MNPEQFRETLSTKGIKLTDMQMEQFALYHETLVEWNKKMNLTAIIDRDDVYLKHFYDSIAAAFYINGQKELKICDVGAGAGFPSIPLKIVYPQLNITIVDSLKKRITFLHHLANELKLDNVTFVHGRAETFGQNQKTRAIFDIVMARAVANLSVLSELCIPLCRQDGLFLSMKGSKADEEVENAKNAIKKLGGSTPSVYTFVLPEENSERSVIIIKKQQRTPKKYPRKPGMPFKIPLK